MLERCLEKEAKNRSGSIGDARVDIQKAFADPDSVFMRPVTTVEPRIRLGTILPWVAAAIAHSFIVEATMVRKLKPAEPHQVMRFTYELPEGQQLNGGLAVFHR